jgi:hypothetical protein
MGAFEKFAGLKSSEIAVWKRDEFSDQSSEGFFVKVAAFKSAGTNHPQPPKPSPNAGQTFQAHCHRRILRVLIQPSFVRAKKRCNESAVRDHSRFSSTPSLEGQRNRTVRKQEGRGSYSERMRTGTGQFRPRCHSRPEEKRASRESC